MSAENTPDLSKIVSVIMEHPELIEEISRLASPAEKSDDGGGEPERKENAVTESVHTSAPASVRISDSKRRSELLHALKPYLSEKRSRAVDSVLTFSEIFDMMKSGKER